jgi:pimeloyl-ACP methyl ester carboxylesterase
MVARKVPTMPKIETADDVSLSYPEPGAGTAVVFGHEFAGDYGTWEPRMRRLARSHRHRSPAA